MRTLVDVKTNHGLGVHCKCMFSIPFMLFVSFDLIFHQVCSICMIFGRTVWYLYYSKLTTILVYSYAPCKHST
jgi:hypothetical protein